MKEDLKQGISGTDPVRIYQARKNISPYVARTPLFRTAELSAKTGTDLYLKMETLQPIGAFKIRGAANAMVLLSEEQKKNGVVTFSTGIPSALPMYETALP